LEQRRDGSRLHVRLVSCRIKKSLITMKKSRCFINFLSFHILFNLNLFLDHFSIAFFEGTRQLSLSCRFLLLFLYILVSPNGWQSSFAFSLVFALTEPHRRFADRLVCGWILVFITVVIHPSIHYHVQYVYDNDASSCILLHFRYLRNFLVFSFACGAAGWAVASSDEFSPSS